MKSRWAVRIFCVLAVLGLFIAYGCHPFTAERNRRRVYAVKTDLEHMVDDVDWILGFDRPTRLYDESRP